MNNDPVLDKLNILCAAASEVISNVFNCTPGAFRPVAMAALRLSMESAVATMSESDRATYTLALGHMDVVAIKKKRGEHRDGLGSC